MKINFFYSRLDKIYETIFTINSLGKKVKNYLTYQQMIQLCYPLYYYRPINDNF